MCERGRVAFMKVSVKSSLDEPIFEVATSVWPVAGEVRLYLACGGRLSLAVLTRTAEKLAVPNLIAGHGGPAGKHSWNTPKSIAVSSFET